jgi:hypothetical protein
MLGLPELLSSVRRAPLRHAPSLIIGAPRVRSRLFSRILKFTNLERSLRMDVSKNVGPLLEASETLPTLSEVDRKTSVHVAFLTVRILGR